MIGTRHLPARSSGRPAFALPLVLALLAFALSPGLAQADSSGVIYGEAPPTVPGKNKAVGEDETRAGSSNTDSGGSTAPGGSGSPGNGSGSAEAGSSGGNNPSTGGSGDAGKGADGKLGTADDQTGSVESGQPVTTSNTADEDGSSSSPLAPILIAIALLAAISIGAVLIKQRRRRDGSDGAVSPKAG